VAAEQTLILIKPDAVRRRLAAEILGRIEARGFVVRAGKLLTASRDLGETHYAEHLGADLGARRRGRGCDRDDAQDDRRDESRPRRARHDPRRSRELDAGQPRARLRLTGVRTARDRALVLRR